MPSRSSFVGFNVASEVDDAEIVVPDLFFRVEAGCEALAFFCWIDCFFLAISEVFSLVGNGTSVVLVLVTDGSVFIVDFVCVSYGGGRFTGG